MRRFLLGLMCGLFLFGFAAPMALHAQVQQQPLRQPQPFPQPPQPFPQPSGAPALPPVEAPKANTDPVFAYFIALCATVGVLTVVIKPSRKRM
jgi:hypothetical protein